MKLLLFVIKRNVPGRIALLKSYSIIMIILVISNVVNWNYYK